MLFHEPINRSLEWLILSRSLLLLLLLLIVSRLSHVVEGQLTPNFSFQVIFDYYVKVVHLWPRLTHFPSLPTTVVILLISKSCDDNPLYRSMVFILWYDPFETNNSISFVSRCARDENDDQFAADVVVVVVLFFICTCVRCFFLSLWLVHYQIMYSNF